MNTLTRTISALVALNLLASGLAFARDVSESGLRDVAATEAREADVAARDMEIAAREAKRQAAMAQRQAAANIRQAEIAVADAEFMAASEDAERTNLADLDLARATLSRSRWPYRSSSVSSVLVIPSAEIETKDLLTINEDVNVMSRIFEMNLQRARISTSSVNPFVSDSVSRFVTVLGTRGRTSIQSLYLQGYGVLFMMKVDFPLSPPYQEQQPDETEQEDEGADKIWQTVRDNLYAPEKVAKRKKDDSAAKYDAEKVESLKTTLVESLKHAANIRNLKPEESIILSITGGGNSVAGLDPTELSMIGSDENIRFLVRDKNTGKTRVIVADSLDRLGLFSPTVLVVRAKKADITGYSKGDLDLEQFRQRVRMLSYPYLEGGSQRSDVLSHYRLRTIPVTNRRTDGP
ncbi:MAG: hypothetical protein ACYS0H_13535 [Planctomycetota bacterium]|jgi:hypothetical protein